MRLNEITLVAIPTIEQEAAREPVRALEDRRGDLMPVERRITRRARCGSNLGADGDLWPMPARQSGRSVLNHVSGADLIVVIGISGSSHADSGSGRRIRRTRGVARGPRFALVAALEEANSKFLSSVEAVAPPSRTSRGWDVERRRRVLALNAPDCAILADPTRNSTLGVVVAEGSIPRTVAVGPNELATAKQVLSAIPGVVLGYVFARDGGGLYAGLRPAADVMADVEDRYSLLGDYIDGIYFDNAVLPADSLDQDTYPTGVQQTAHDYWTALLGQVRAAHPGARGQRPPGTPQLPHSQMMLLSGQSPNKWLLAVADYLLMWETNVPSYYQHFSAYGQLLVPPRGPTTA